MGDERQTPDEKLGAGIRLTSLLGFRALLAPRGVAGDPSAAPLAAMVLGLARLLLAGTERHGTPRGSVRDSRITGRRAGGEVMEFSGSGPRTARGSRPRFRHSGRSVAPGPLPPRKWNGRVGLPARTRSSEGARGRRSAPGRGRGTSPRGRSPRRGSRPTWPRGTGRRRSSPPGRFKNLQA